MIEKLRLLAEKLTTLLEDLWLSHPIVVKAAGMAVVAVILLGASLAFGLFESNYDLNGPYDRIYPTAPGATP